MAQEVLTSPVVRPKEGRPRPSRLRRAALIAAVVVVAILLLLWYVGVFGGNVRTVEAGRVYRSAQLTGANLDSVLNARHIRTVINLRGGSDNDSWYRSEITSCDRLGVRHLDIPFSAVKMPPPEQLQKLLTAFDTTTYPILYHCRGGSDRSGLASVLYLNIYRHVPLDQAENSQLTWRYGHLSWGQAHAMNDFLAFYRQTSNGMGLRDWITTRYPALYAKLPEDQKIKENQQAPDDLPSPAHATLTH